MDAPASGKPDKDKQHEDQPNDKWATYSGAKGQSQFPHPPACKAGGMRASPLPRVSSCFVALRGGHRPVLGEQVETLSLAPCAPLHAHLYDEHKQGYHG